MGASDAWPVSASDLQSASWVTAWFALALNHTYSSAPTVRHAQVSFQGYTAYVAPRHGDSTALYDNTSARYFEAMLNGTLELDFVWYFDIQDLDNGAGWAPGPPCVKPKGYVCAPAFNDKNERRILYFSAATGKCYFSAGSGGNSCDAVSIAWRTPAIPRRLDTYDLEDPYYIERRAFFFDGAGLLRVGRKNDDYAVVVKSVEAWTSINPDSPHANFLALQLGNTSKPLLACCYQLPVPSNATDVQYATYDYAAQGNPTADLAWSTNSACTADKAFGPASQGCIFKTQPASLLRPTVPWPPPPPGAPPGPPRPPGSYVPFPRRGLKTYVAGIDTRKNHDVLAAGATYIALAAVAAGIALVVGRFRQRSG